MAILFAVAQRSVNDGWFLLLLYPLKVKSLSLGLFPGLVVLEGPKSRFQTRLIEPERCADVAGWLGPLRRVGRDGSFPGATSEGMR